MTSVFPSTHTRTTVTSAARPFVLLPLASRTLLLGVVACSVAISLHFTNSDAATKAGPDLTNLLRFMAAVKTVLASVCSLRCSGG